MNKAKRLLLGGYTFSQEARNAFAAMTVKPGLRRAKAYNLLVRTLKNGAIWPKLESLVLFGAHDQQAALVDLRNPNFIWTATNVPTFVVDEGFTGSGDPTYQGLDGPAVGSLFVQNSAHLGIWLLTNPTAADDPVAGLYDSANVAAIRARNAGGDFDAWVNAASSAVVSDGAAANPNIGHLLVNRSAAGALQLYKNGASVAVDTDASSIVPGGAYYASYTADQVFAFHAGGSLSADEVAVLYAALYVYAQHIGAA